MSERTIFLDTETTGRTIALARVIEIAAIEVDENFQPIRVFHEYLDPKQSVGNSVQIHGLSDAFLHGRKTFRDIVSSFKDFIAGATIYAHNMPFDEGVINSELSRCGEGRLADFANLLDTLQWARTKVGCGNASLDKLVSHFGIDGSARQTHHGALIDAELLIQVFLCLGKREEVARTLDFNEINTKDEEYQASVTPPPVPSLAASFSEPDDDEPKNDDASDDTNRLNLLSDYEDKLEAIISFADDHPFFDGSMYEDMLEKYQETGFLSDAQMQAIDNVIDGFHIHTY